MNDSRAFDQLKTLASSSSENWFGSDRKKEREREIGKREERESEVGYVRLLRLRERGREECASYRRVLITSAHVCGLFTILLHHLSLSLSLSLYNVQHIRILPSSLSHTHTQSLSKSVPTPTFAIFTHALSLSLSLSLSDLNSHTFIVSTDVTHKYTL